jgi:hypothetical protein
VALISLEHRVSFRLRAIAFLAVCVSTVSGVVGAQGSSEPMFRTEPPVQQRVVAEYQYFFTVNRYTSPVPVAITTRDKASYSSPELAAMALISAMATQDFEWFRSVWDIASVKRLEERDKAANQDPSFWKNAWARAFANTRVELTTRIETGDYVLIVYRIVPANATSAQSEGVELTTALKSEKGRWFATQELADDPVLSYWKTPDVRVKRTIREPRQ